MWKYISIIVALLTIVRSEYKYETKWFTVPLDHFGYQRSETFKIKYLQSDDYWDRGSGPIFFYTGNEGQIEVFAQHTGFMWEIASEFRAKVVFAEHRYYGASMPFGNKSLDTDHIGYLTAAQALADYADLIDYLQGNSLKPKYPVIAFGGSYGGMLAAYFRMKYPHVVSGAIAASAPVHMYPGMVPCEVFNRIVTSSFKSVTTNCSDNIRHSWELIRNFAKTPNGTAWLHKNWNLCDPVNTAEEVQVLIDFLEDMYVTLAMVNYPFASDFLLPLPAYPVRSVCQYLSKSLSGQNLLEAVGYVLSTYTNYNNSKPRCVDFKKGDNYGNLDASGWDYQTCTEMVMPMCATGTSDMFEPSPWDFAQFSEQCRRKYRVTPRPDAARVLYGGNRLEAASNIVFSNGLLDPWTAGGVLNTISDTVKAVVILDSAHHLDLMPSNPADPGTVTMARSIHRQNIREWINQFAELSKKQRP